MEKLKEKRPALPKIEDILDAAVPAPPEETEPPPATAQAGDQDAQVVEESVGRAGAETHVDTEPEALPALPVDVDPIDPPTPELAAEASWYAFWNPFRSEIAARGFVSQLEKVTGLDYRIVKVKAGVYQVAFAYDNDQERDARLSQIQAATGLDLTGT